MTCDTSERIVTTSEKEASGHPRRPYAPPRIEVVNALQAVVLGGSPGGGDSGAGMGTEIFPR